MYLSFIGMSGSGKSHWSMKLADLGFRRFCCDDLITERLAPELTRTDGTVMDLGEWMGFPYESNYKVRESKYLACEIEVISEILEYLEHLGRDAEENVVLDTTGSVIYTGEKILKKLCQCTTVVHFSTPHEIKESMLEAYVALPRPVLWRDVFNKEPDETDEEALTRCYPKLLFARERLYERYADVTISYYSRIKKGFGVNDFLDEVRAAIS